VPKHFSKSRAILTTSGAEIGFLSVLHTFGSRSCSMLRTKWACRAIRNFARHSSNVWSGARGSQS
jgi:hypothetical protein